MAGKKEGRKEGSKESIWMNGWMDGWMNETGRSPQPAVALSFPFRPPAFAFVVSALQETRPISLHRTFFSSFLLLILLLLLLLSFHTLSSS
jgi:hypothetical protein